MMIFNMSTSYFHKNSFHYFEGLFNDETDFRVRYVASTKWPFTISFSQKTILIALSTNNGMKCEQETLG